MSDLVDTIVAVLIREPTVIAAYLFGSMAKESGGPDSDVDVAVLLQEGETEFPQLEIMSTLEKKLGRRVELIVLNRATELLKHEIRKSGVLILERDREKRKQFEIRSRKHFEDFLYLHNRYVTNVLYKNIHG